MNISEAKAIANRIHKYVMDKRKDPVGNQNCLLCVWCSEAQFRDIDILPRPVYSPRDSIFTHIDRGLEIVENPTKLSVSNITELKKKVLLAFNDARYYCHVNWNGSEGGHEFILLLLTHKIYVMDSQAGLVVPIDSDKGMYYFTDINWSNTFIARMDDKELNKELLYKENSPNKTVEWDTKIDIPYMRKHGMIPDADHTMRDATEKDLEFVTFSELETVGENKNDPKVVKYIKQDAKDSLGHTKIIVVNGEDVGVYQAYATNKWGLREGKKDWWYLAHIYIKPEYRGMGIGTNIIKKDIREHDKILLQVMKSNQRARKLYESLGFKFSQENDHGGIIMRYEKGKSVQESFMDEYDNPLSKINKFFDSMKDFEYGFYADGKKYTGDILDEPNVFDKYHLMSSEEIEQHKVCVCWDACRYEAEWFKNNLPNVEIRTYYCEYEPKIGNTHTWLVFKLDDKWYVFEYTWYSKRGIKEISSPEALADEYIRDIPLHEHSPAKLKDAKYVLIEYDPLQDKPGISCVEFMDHKWHNGTLIKTNCKSEEELIDTFEFTNEKWKPQFELSSIQETYIAPTDKLIPIPDYPYDKVYMGTSTKFIPTKDVYFVTQSIANASIFSGRDKVYPELRKRGIYQYNLGYSEWGSSASEPLKTVHIIVEKGSRIKTEVPYFEPFEFTATGYIHKIDLSKMKDHIYKYDWMADECEACVAGINKLDVIKTTKVTITYKVCHEKDRRKLINESYKEGGLFLMDDMNELYTIVDDDGDVVFEAHVSRMTPEQKERHEERKMNAAALRNAEKMGYNPTKAKREVQAELEEYGRYDIARRDKRKRLPKKGLFDNNWFATSLGKGSTVDASGRKHEYELYSGSSDSAGSDGKAKKLHHSGKTLKGKNDFDYIHNHEVGHMAQIDHGLYDDDSTSIGIEAKGKKSMGLAEDYAFKCAKWFAKKYKSKLNSHDIDPRELHADYLSARKVGFNRAYKGIKKLYSTIDVFSTPINWLNMNDTLNDSIDPHSFSAGRDFVNNIKDKYGIAFNLEKYTKDRSYRENIKAKLEKEDRIALGKYMDEVTKKIRAENKNGRIGRTTGDYRALFIQDMMWLHKGRRDRCSMKYPEWTPEEKKAFMEFYVDDELTKEDVIEMEEFREYMTSDEESYAIVDDEDIVQEADNEQEAEMEDENDESMTIDDQPDIDEDDSDDGEIEPEDISDVSNDESENEDDDEETIDINTMNDPLDDYADDFNTEESKEEEGEKVDDEMIDIPGFDDDDEEPVDAIKKPNIDEMISKDDNNTPEQTPTQPTEPTQTIDIGINVSGFGSDNSPVQNQYDPKEIERLNTLVASENSAIGEYFQASKDTNVDVLRRLFSDIGEEERFHVEQLLFAKSQITGERYIPRDPNIKKEYEELLAMGMNEEDAMNTAADKVGLMRSQQAAQADAVQEMAEICDKLDMIETMIDQDYMLYTIAESVTSFDDVDDAMQTFVEAYLNDQYNSAEMILEAVGNVGDPKPKPPKNKVQQGPGVLNAVSQFFSRIIQNIGNLIGVVVRFIKKQVMIMKQKASWYKNHSLPDIFRKGFNLYFYNQSGDNAGFAYSDAAKYLVRLIYCCLMVAKQTQPPIGFDYGKDRMRFGQYVKDDFRPKNLDDAINGIKNIVMTKTKVVINDDNKDGFLKDAFGIGGSAADNNGSGAYENFRRLLSDFKGAAQAADKLTKDLAALKGDHNSMYFKEDGRATFDKLVSSMKTIVKGFQMFLKCINSDIKTLIKLSKAYTEVNVSEDELPTVSNEEIDKLVNIAKTMFEDNLSKINQIKDSSLSDEDKISKLQELIKSLGGEPVVKEFAVDEMYQEAAADPGIDYKAFVKSSGYDENKLKNIISGTIKRACLKIINNIKNKSSSNGTKTNSGVKPNENNGSVLKAKQALKVIKNTMNPEFHSIRNILLSDKYSSGFNGSTKADMLKRKREEIYSKYKNVFNESFSDIVNEEIITEAASQEAIMAANLFKKGNLQYQLVDELRNANINDIGGFATYCEAKKYSEAKVKSLVYAIIIKMLDKIIPRIGE